MILPDWVTHHTITLILYCYKNSSCKICFPGKYSSDEYLSYCLDCPQGKYNDKFEQHLINSCNDCEKGKWNIYTGSTDLKNCTQCLPGKYSEKLAAINIDTCIVLSIPV